MADYIPSADDAKIIWLTNLRDTIDAYSATLGITAGRVTQIKAWCNDLIDEINATNTAKQAWLAAAATKATQETTSLAGLRGEIAQWKPNPDMTPAIEAALKIVGNGGGFDPNTFKAEITGEVFSGYVRIKFKKGRSGGINLYSRLQGQTAWKFVSRDTNSPYDDHTPLAVPGTPEVREYQVFGVLNDQQIGQPSDIVSVTFGG
ncbi:MAG: hypothetical protein WCS99_13960 [Limisphaerales bacterium]